MAFRSTLRSEEIIKKGDYDPVSFGVDLKNGELYINYLEGEIVDGVFRKANYSDVKTAPVISKDDFKVILDRHPELYPLLRTIIYEELPRVLGIEGEVV